MKGNVISGMSYVEENNLLPKKSGFTDDYDETIEPSVTSAFATAAFRFGHSLVQGNMEYVLFTVCRVIPYRTFGHKSQ